MGSNRSGIQLAIETDNDYRVEIGDGSNNWIWQLTDKDAKQGKWTHFALTRESNKIRFFEDGVQIAKQTSGTAVGDPRSSAIGGYANNDSDNYGFNGFISNFRIVNGSSVYPATDDQLNQRVFVPPTAPLTNVTNTKLLCCQSSTSATEAAVIPTGSITANGGAAATTFNPFNTDINTVRGQETEYCTWNPLAVQPSGHGGFRDGNLEIIADTAGSHKATLATFAIPSSGKWYWEVKAYRTGANNNGGGAVGVAEASTLAPTAASGNRLGETNSSSWVVSLTDFDARHAGNADYADYLNGGTTENDTAIIGIAVDMDNDKMWMHYGGVYGNAGGIGNPVTGANPAFSGEFSGLEIFPAAGVTVDSGSGFLRANWGQKPFSFPPPEGYQPLNAANVRPVKVISRPNQYVGVTTYTGTTGGGTIKDHNILFTPDLVWVKNRTSAEDHKLYDTVRGESGGNFYNLEPNTTATSVTESGAVTSMIEGGFTSTGGGHINSNGAPFVSWMWKAGGSKNTFNVDDVGYASAAAAGLTGGDITPTGASVGTKQGFSIIEFTGSGSGTPSIPHGLSEAPTFIVQKDTEATTGWRTFAYDGSTWKIGNLNNTDALVNATETAPTSSLFYANGNGNATNTQIAYVWHDVPGLQKFGTYEGSGVAGNYVHLGFRPALLWIKNIDSTAINNWGIIDSTRSYANVGNHTLATNLNNVESYYGDGASVFGSGNKIDLLSNGFRLQETSGFGNTSGITFLYCAWAEAPSIDLYGGGANAR